MKMKIFIAIVLLVGVSAVQRVRQHEFNVQIREHLIEPQHTRKRPPISINTVIIGGSPAKQDQFPNVCAIIQDGSKFCGGTLITPTHVLTACHCVDRVKIFTLYFGAINWRDSTTRIAVTTSKKIAHPSYNSRTVANDIALIVMAANSLQSKHFTSSPPRVALTRLPRESDRNFQYIGKRATAAGWGKDSDAGTVTSTLNYASAMTVLPNNISASYFGSIIQSSTLCCYGNETQNTCSGDSGGLLMYMESDGIPTQIGITSFGSAVTCAKYPSCFARVTFYLPWIKSKIPKISLRP